jgi:hypothetical protein
VIRQEGYVTKKIPESTWALELHRFTNRNAGRATTVEVDTPDFGAGSEPHEFPLRGITYDARGERVLITLGQQASAERQLTHAINDATAIFLLVDLKGRDEALAIHQKQTSTLLRFVDL